MTTPTEERSYHFADFIRFIAMCAIIFQHSFIVEKEFLLTDSASVITFFFMKVISKIGSISFFLISGFLLSAALDRYSSKEYLNKRVKNIFKPYILFVGIYLALTLIGGFFGQHKLNSIAELPAFLAAKIINTLFFTSYWFIFNYFISVMIVLSMRKYLYERWFGAILFACTAMYAINVHFEWFTPHHSTAFMGFTFFLWLGANLKKNEQFFWNIIDTTPYWKIITIILISLSVNFYETVILLQNGATVVDGSLKFSNILYCLSVFVLLCKIGTKVTFNFLNPRDETYPIYLIHPIFLKIINYAVLPLLPALHSSLTIDKPSETSWLNVFLFQVGWFIGIYALSLIAVKLILYSPMRWVFGKQGRAMVSPLASIRVWVNGVKNLKFR
jgi:probable poly-beta-1,6-N-acetyl-D-glucosamine export protein